MHKTTLITGIDWYISNNHMSNNYTGLFWEFDWSHFYACPILTEVKDHNRVYNSITEALRVQSEDELLSNTILMFIHGHIFL